MDCYLFWMYNLIGLLWWWLYKCWFYIVLILILLIFVLRIISIKWWDNGCKVRVGGSSDGWFVFFLSYIWIFMLNFLFMKMVRCFLIFFLWCGICLFFEFGIYYDELGFWLILSGFEWYFGGWIDVVLFLFVCDLLKG